jgi:hypothetical protein
MNSQFPNPRVRTGLLGNFRFLVLIFDDQDELIIFVIQQAFYPIVLTIRFLVSSAYIFNQFINLVVGHSWEHFILFQVFSSYALH